MATPCLIFTFLFLVSMTWLTEIKGNNPIPSLIGNRERRHYYLLFPEPQFVRESIDNSYLHDSWHHPIQPNSAAVATPFNTQARVLNSPTTSLTYSSGDTSIATSGRTMSAFANLFGLQSLRPVCPTCPSCPPCPSPTCPMCPTLKENPPGCPVPPLSTTETIPVTALSDCRTFATANSCTRLTAAQSGTFTVSFTGASDGATAYFGIVATCSKSRISISCDAIPKTTTVRTRGQPNGITSGITATEYGFAQVIVNFISGANNVEVKCKWETA